MAITTLLKQDSHVRKLRQMLRNGSYNINTREFIRELEHLHSIRLSRRLQVTDVINRFQGRYMRTVLQNQATRSRSVTIKMRCFRTQAKLKRHLDDLVKYLMATYGEQLRRTAGTKSERENVIRSVFGKAENIQEELTTAMAIADMLIDDLDQNGWTNQRIIDMVKILQERGKQF
ncbi:MAG TPA: hypothetical protein VNX68_19105 [Nitrosopumilaceae archaeon]|jgi:hypothetical protein|nr:hypothetical protein [Nitrosopumilaceae archaeon]